MKKIHISLLGKVVIAIAAGILFGQFLPGGIARLFVTFNSLFGEFLSFSIPLIIVGLVTPAIGDLGKGAGRLLLITALIAYGSTIFSGFFTFFSGAAIFPGILPTHAELTALDNPENAMLIPYFKVAMPPLMGVMTALILSFVVGLGLSQADRSGDHPVVAAAYLRYLPQYDCQRTGGQHHQHVYQGDCRDLRAARLIALDPVHHRRIGGPQESVTSVAQHVASLRNRFGYAILSRNDSRHVGTSRQEWRT